MTASPIKAIVDSYQDPIIKTYSRIRFTILRQPFLEEIDQWLPAEGRVLDLGSGFGLFSLYFATTHPKRHVVGVELSEKRVAQARASAQRLGLANVEYHVADVLQWEAPGGLFDAIYMLDVVHHLPQESVPAFLARLVSLLKPGGTLLLKDVSDKPRYKMLFTLALDRLMVGMEPIRYWSPAALGEVLQNLGLDVKRHLMNDILPYPHVLYICKRTEADAKIARLDPRAAGRH
jgi:2-polyprenyl-3-methyl-5-hydroxy-6-metoxy-1,4-benzoquinol methylase